MKQITFSLKDEEHKRIENICKKETRSKASLIRHLVFQKIEEIYGTNNSL